VKRSNNSNGRTLLCSDWSTAKNLRVIVDQDKLLSPILFTSLRVIIKLSAPSELYAKSGVPPRSFMRSGADTLRRSNELWKGSQFRILVTLGRNWNRIRLTDCLQKRIIQAPARIILFCSHKMSEYVPRRISRKPSRLVTVKAEEKENFIAGIKLFWF